ncbi:MAG: hypothetical protein KGY56_10815 [Desulfobacterales bacterium]|nr:hypothetical protein [Desulfobacterales bacterium]
MQGTPERRTYKDDLYAAYLDFAESIGRPPLPRARFFKALYLTAPARPKGVPVRERNSRRWVVSGIGLK